MFPPFTSATTDQTRRRQRCHITADLRVYSVSTGLLQLTVSRPTVTTHLRRTITLQRVQNAAARLVLNLNLRDHVTPALKQLLVTCRTQNQIQVVYIDASNSHWTCKSKANMCNGRRHVALCPASANEKLTVQKCSDITMLSSAFI